MSTNNISFRGEIRKTSAFFRWKKCLICCYARRDRMNTYYSNSRFWAINYHLHYISWHSLYWHTKKLGHMYTFSLLEDGHVAWKIRCHLWSSSYSEYCYTAQVPANQIYPYLQIRHFFLQKSDDTVNPLYTDTRYNDQIRYNDNLNVTKPLLKRWQLMRNYARLIALNFQVAYVLDIC